MALLVVLVVAAVFRITRFVVADAFPPMEALRDWIEGRSGEDSAIAYFVYCPWCVSVWVALAVTYATDALLTHGLPAPFLVALTASGVTGLTATHLDPPSE